MSVITTNYLKLKYPNPADLTTPFDWEVFLNDNFDLIDEMKTLGGMAVFNASKYLDSTTARFKFEDIITEATSNGWILDGIMIYFPAGDYCLVDSTHLSTGMTFGDTTTLTAGVALIGAPGARIITSVAGSAITDIINVVGVDNVLISGLNIVGDADTNPGSTHVGIRITESENVHITNCTIENVKHGIMLNDATTSRVAKRVWIDNNRIEDYLGRAIYAYTSEDVTIESNYIAISTSLNHPTSATGANAIEFVPGAGGEVQTCRIVNNSIIRARRNAIQLTHNSGAGVAPIQIFVDNNTIDSPGLYANPLTETTKATRGSGIYSTVYDSATATVTLSITNNFIRDPLADGIYVENASNAMITGNHIRMMDAKNTVTYASLHGIECVDTDYAIIRANRIYNGYIATVLSPVWASVQRDAIYLSSSDYVVLADNRIINWFIVAATCLDLVYMMNRVTGYASTVDDAIPSLSCSGCTFLNPMISEKYVAPNELMTTLPSGYTQSGTLVMDVTNGGSYFAFSPYLTSTTANQSRVTCAVEMPAKKANGALVVKVPVRSLGAAFTANFDILVGSYSLTATGTQAFASPYTATTAVSAPSSTCGPSIASFSIPTSALPAENSIMMVTLLRKDTQTTNVATYGVKFVMSNQVGGFNEG